MTGLLPGILRNWRRAGLVGAPALPDGYSDAQLTHIYQILNLTASGDALSEVRLRLPAAGSSAGRNCMFSWTILPVSICRIASDRQGATTAAMTL